MKRNKLAMTSAVLAMAIGGVLVSALPAFAASGSHSCAQTDEVCNVSVAASASTFASFVTNFPGSGYSGGYFLLKASGATLCSGTMALHTQKSCSFASYTGTVTFSYGKSNAGAGSVTLATN